MITESWLNDKVTNGLLDQEYRFNIIRCDRSTDAGGGVCADKSLDIVEIPVTKHFPRLELTRFWRIIGWRLSVSINDMLCYDMLCFDVFLRTSIF